MRFLRVRSWFAAAGLTAGLGGAMASGLAAQGVMQDAGPAPAEMGPPPVFRYTLAGRENAEGGSALVATPEGALIALLPLKDGQWALKRVTGWATGAVHEETITIDGRVPGEKVWPEEMNLTLDPSGKVLIVRLCFQCRSWSEYWPGAKMVPKAVVRVVDADSFKVAGEQLLTDPVIATGIWRFNPQGQLVVYGLKDYSHTGAGPDRIDTAEHRAEILSVPELKETERCSYTSIRQSLLTGQPPRAKEAVAKGNADCAAELRAAGSESIEKMWGALNGYPGLAASKHVKRIRGCTFEDAGASDCWAVYACVGDKSVIVWPKEVWRRSMVYRVADGQEVMSMKLPFGEKVDTRVASMGGKDYLLMLRNQVRLEVYELQSGDNQVPRPS